MKNAIHKKDALIHGSLIFFILYFATLPLYSEWIGRKFPNIWTCAYKRLSGGPCPFCGTMTALKRFFSGEDTNPDAKYQILLICVGIITITEFLCALAALTGVCSGRTMRIITISSIIFISAQALSVFIVFILNW